MDEDADLFRPPWEDDGPLPSGRRAARASEALLIPLARAQDAVARLDASVAAAPDDIAAGLRARLALLEAAGFLAHRGPPVHPHDLALRDAHLTGSYTLAALTGRLREAAPGSTVAGGKGWPTTTSLPKPWPTPGTGAGSPSLAQLGAPLADDAATRAWLVALPGPGAWLLDCVAEAARRGARERDRLQAAAHRIAALPGSARSRLRAAGTNALREPLVTGNLLARRLGVSARAGLDLATGLVAAGVLREMTERAAWRAFVIA